MSSRQRTPYQYIDHETSGEKKPCLIALIRWRQDSLFSFLPLDIPVLELDIVRIERQIGMIVVPNHLYICRLRHLLENFPKSRYGANVPPKTQESIDELPPEIAISIALNTNGLSVLSMRNILVLSIRYIS